MATFLFVHGGWHGAWCWCRVIPRLESKGHRALVLDLPGCGRDKTSTSGLTLTDYVDAVVSRIDDIPEPVHLVGHSSGGVVVTQVAEQRPSKLERLIYLAAFIPKTGESILSLFQQATESFLLRSIVPSADQTHLTIPEGAMEESFYAQCPPEFVALARLCLVPQPVGPGMTPVTTTDANFGRVRRVYIETKQDRAIPLAMQRRMIETSACERIFTLDTDHAPFFSAPDELVAHLTAV